VPEKTILSSYKYELSGFGKLSMSIVVSIKTKILSLAKILIS